MSTFPYIKNHALTQKSEQESNRAGEHPSEGAIVLLAQYTGTHLNLPTCS